LKKHSEFFVAALKEGWKEGEEQVVRLPEHESEAFNIFARFVYTKRIYCKRDGDYDESTGNDEEWRRLLDACLMGVSLISPSLQDAVVDAITAKVNNNAIPPSSYHNTVWSKTAGDNALKRLIVDIAVWKWDPKLLRERCADAPHGFLVDVVIRLKGLDSGGGEENCPFAMPACTYHEHSAASKPCYKTLVFP